MLLFINTLGFPSHKHHTGTKHQTHACALELEASNAHYLEVQNPNAKLWTIKKFSFITYAIPVTWSYRVSEANKLNSVFLWKKQIVVLSWGRRDNFVKVIFWPALWKKKTFFSPLQMPIDWFYSTTHNYYSVILITIGNSGWEGTGGF